MFVISNEFLEPHIKTIKKSVAHGNWWGVNKPVLGWAFLLGCFAHFSNHVILEPYRAISNMMVVPIPLWSAVTMATLPLRFIIFSLANDGDV